MQQLLTMIFFPVMFNLLVIWMYSLLAFYLQFIIGMYIFSMGPLFLLVMAIRCVS